MFKEVRKVFLYQYATLMLVILSVLIVMNQVVQMQPLTKLPISEPKLVYQPDFLHTEIIIDNLFAEHKFQRNKLEPLVELLNNHNIDLTIDLNEQSEPVSKIYQLTEILKDFGLDQDSFSIKISADPTLQSGSAKVRLSWSRV